MIHDTVWIGRRLVRVVAVVMVVLAACSPSAGIQIRSASCDPQSGMSGDLAADIVGVWRFTWTGSADGGPAQMLMTFTPDGTVTTLTARFERTSWVYRIEGDGVRMSATASNSDLQALYSVWQFAAGAWQVSAVGYGDTTLERCD